MKKKSSAIAIFFTMVLLTACGLASSSTTREIALNTHDTRGLYVLEDDLVVRYECDASVIVINRANCTKSVQKLFFWGVEDYLRRSFGNDLDKYDFQVHQLTVKIILIDTQLDQLLSTDPDHVPDLLPKINNLQESITSLESLMNDVNDQIARVRSELLRNESPDLRLLLRDLEGKIAIHRQERNRLQAELNKLRKQYYDANSGIITRQTFDRLMNQRREYLSQLSDATRYLQVQMDEITALHEWLKFLKDGSAWEFMRSDTDKTAMVAKEMGYLFSYFYAPNGSRTVEVNWNELSQRYDVWVPGPGVMLRELNLRFPQFGHCSGFRFKSDRFDVTILGPYRGTNLDHSSNESPIFSETISGTWHISPICPGTYDPDLHRVHLYRLK